ncbi:uncharacterized protein LOC111398428 [Olea europaea var. sylvestris]|uniref:uncharacterized protein LOC111398428 n=1 Tax=Olea europaea var. sylvestris TaxID=158386 RepID=UPI000C1CD41C|nr:uncharacterized protein LOC111398428 [Olea europaea var. sylvestris]
MVDVAAGGILMAKTAEATYVLLDDIATNNYQWSSERSGVKKVAGLHEVDPITALAAQVASLTNQIVILTTQGNQQKVDSVMSTSSSRQETEVANDRNTLQPLPEFNTQNSDGKPPLEDILGTFIYETRSRFNNDESRLDNIETHVSNMGATMKNLEVQIGQLATSMKSQQKGKFPGDTEVNPKVHCKAIVLRSGKQVGENELTEDSNPTPDKEKEQVVEEQEKQAKGTNKAHKTYFVSFPDNPPILTPPLPFPQHALEQMPNYAKFMKKVMSKKRKLEEYETVKLTEECSGIIQKKLPQKRKDPGSFTIPCTIGSSSFEKALCDLGASINLMPLSVFKKLGLGEVKLTTMTLQLADRSLTYPRGIIEDMLVKVDKFIFPADFVVLDMEEDQEIPLILRRPFLVTERALIDVQGGQLTLRVNEEEVRFNIYQAMKYSDDNDTCHRIDFIDSAMRDEKLCIEDPLEQCMMFSTTKDDISTFGEYIRSKDLSEEADDKESNESSKIELKQLPDHLRYAFLGNKSAFPVIISLSLTRDKEDRLLKVVRDHKAALGWSIVDIKGISSTICMHKILTEESYKPSIEHQRRLNPAMKEVV